jgi:hypothetical protein
MDSSFHGGPSLGYLQLKSDVDIPSDAARAIPKPVALHATLVKKQTNSVATAAAQKLKTVCRPKGVGNLHQTKAHKTTDQNLGLQRNLDLPHDH